MLSAPGSATLDYRPDIDGLRAFAVLSVLGFHAFPEWLPGGFVGVDVFFVISGFLITRLILLDLARGEFALTGFYARRMRRILPALLLVLVVSLCLGALVLFADEYARLGEHVAAGAAFVMNWVLWREAGYFDAAAHTKPLLHLWSLAVEEQFYLLWPLVLMALARWTQRPSRWVVLVMLASLLASVWTTARGGSLAFYAPHTRLWEMAAGATLAALPIEHRQLLGRVSPSLWAAAGVACLALAVGFLDSTRSYPGLWALLPVAGTWAVLAAGLRARLNRSVWAHPFWVHVGLISYPLYLWHWPLLVLAEIYASEPLSVAHRLGVLALAGLLAEWTYWGLERPVRAATRSASWRRVVVGALGLGLLAVAAAGWAVRQAQGWPSRIEAQERFMAYFQNRYPTWQYFEKLDLRRQWRQECAFFDTDRYLREGRLPGGIVNSAPRAALASDCTDRDGRAHAVLLWGDSHAQALAPGLRDHLPADWQLLQVTSTGCTPRWDVTQPSATSQCLQSNYTAMQTVRRQRPEVVVVAQDAGHEADTLEAFAQALAQAGVPRTIFMGPSPHWHSDLPQLFARRLWATQAQRTWQGIDQAVVSGNQHLRQRLSSAVYVSARATYFDTLAVLCNTAGCLTHLDPADVAASITTWDRAHLTPQASAWLASHGLVQAITAPLSQESLAPLGSGAAGAT